MSEYFHYINHSKKQRFSIGEFGNSDKFSGIGYGLSARAFALLLTESNDHDIKMKDTLFGSWIGDEIQCIGDHGNIQDKYFGYDEIIFEIVTMLISAGDLEEIIEASKLDNGLFSKLCEYVFMSNDNVLENYICKAHGLTWKKKYKELTPNYIKNNNEY